MTQTKIAWHGLHTGEEPPLLPAGGIFFSGCNLHCVFCQNFQISQQYLGRLFDSQELAGMMLELQILGAANIDLVTPTIWHQCIKEAIISAKGQGLKIPIAWNSNGYESPDIIKEMDGLIDIYLPDFKYSHDDLAFKYSGIKDYFATAQTAIAEMYRQVGNLQIVNNKAAKGLIVRHMVLPDQLTNSFGVLDTLAAIDLELHISLMNQYSPLYQADRFPELGRAVTAEEFAIVHQYQLKLGLGNGWIQEAGSQENLIPDFCKVEPFNNNPITF
ncbi:MAG: radical SAM protein [Candidatus Falkowbacteria bacterium]